MSDRTFIVVYHKDGSVFRVSTDHEEMLNGALERYLGQGPAWTREADSDGDELLSFTLIGGNKYRCLVSSIYSYLVSTSEGRRVSAEIEAELSREETVQSVCPPPTAVPQ
jgi:hypothetical protein